MSQARAIELRAIGAIARADFLERVRRYSFLLTLLFATFLGYAAATGRIMIQLGGHRGVYTSAWVGALVALVTTCWVSLVGFYIVKGGIDRDRQTGVGQVLAATPLSKPTYTLGKFLSNFAVLGSLVFVLARGGCDADFCSRRYASRFFCAAQPVCRCGVAGDAADGSALRFCLRRCRCCAAESAMLRGFLCGRFSASRFRRSQESSGSTRSEI